MATHAYEWGDPIVGPPGGNLIYWAQNAKQIEEFIKANNIHPATIGPMVGRDEAAAKALIDAPTIGPMVGRDEAAAKALIDLRIRGGITIAHLHFNDRIYLLNHEQWAKFSAGIIATAKARLAKVHAVSFEEGIVLGSIAQTLVKE